MSPYGASARLRTLPLRRGLFLAFALLVLLMAGTGFLLSTIEQRRLVEELSPLVLERTERQAESELRELFEPIRKRLAMDWRLVRNGLIDGYDPPEVTRQLLPGLYHLSTVGSMMVADTTGHQFLLMRYDSTVVESPLLSHRTDLPAPALTTPQYFTRDFRPAQWGERSVWTLWQPDGLAPVQVWEEDLPGYDPKTRLWHVQALARYRALAEAGDTLLPERAIAWTDVYTFFTTQAPGISASLAVRDPAGRLVIVAYDLLLDAVSTYTSAQAPTANGVVFVVSDSGNMVGFPRHERFATAAGRQTSYLQPAEALGLRPLSGWVSAWRARTTDAPATVRYSVAGDTWWAGYRPFDLEPGRRLWIGVAVPEADLVAGAERDRRILLAVAGGTLLLALLLAGLLARSISHPLAGIAGRAERIRGLNLAPVPPVTSRLREVHRLAGAIEGMRGALLEHMAGRERASEALAESESRFRATFEQAAVGMVHVSPEGRLLRVNRRFQEITGYDAGELRDLSFLDVTHPDDRERDWERLEQFLRGERQTDQWEKRYLRKDGATVWALLTVSLLRTAEGAPRYFISVVQDIGERKSLEEQLRQSQKLEAVGQLAGGVAHDFNNLLTAILGYSALLREALADGHAGRADLDQIDLAAHRASDLTRQLLAFARRQHVEARVVRINELVAGTDQMLRRLIGEQVEFETRLGPDVPSVRVDPGQLQQVLVNLVVNARDAMPGGGRLVVSTEVRTLPAPNVRMPPGIAEGRYVVLAVSDTGMGIAPEVQERIFEPFFTTKPAGKGTGLGLSTCWGIVHHAAGFIDVESLPERGSTFRVFLPAVAAGTPAAVAPRPAAPVEGARGQETILLAEDEAQLRAISARSLEARGFHVLLARDGAEALEVAAAHGGRIDLLVTDVVMPRLGGPDLARRLRVQRPGLPVLFVSGYADGGAFAAGGLGPRHELLAKPFSPDALVRRVRETLDRQHVRAGPDT